MRPLLPARTMDELVQLDEAEAARAFFDSYNAVILFRLLPVCGLIAAISGAFFALQGRFSDLALAITVLVAVRTIQSSRDSHGLSRHFQPVLLGFLTLQFVQVSTVSASSSVTPLEFFLPALLLLFRLKWTAAAWPLAALWTISCGRQLLDYAIADQRPEIWAIAGQTAVSLVVLIVGDHLLEGRHRLFVADWRRESRLLRERNRMREELGDARKIQLSMLPRSAPKLPWLDIAGISIPASEVGGDYYDYFTISESQQVVVVADVAGHGVASGLLLSGIRSCLHLMLLEAPPEPTEILSRLDQMVRKTTTRHFFVTLLYALFDAEKRTVTVSSAGHPPLLHFDSQSREVREVALMSLPLGTGLVSQRQQRTFDFRPSDLFLLYSDGIAETVNARNEDYGYERLRHRLQTTAHDRRAQEIRNTMLGDIVTFKGDCEQTDDITLVVIKAR